MTTPFLYVPTFAPVVNGASVPNGLLYTYQAGTTNPKPTFQDPAGVQPNTNPVVLDITGAATVRLEPGSYHFVLTDATGTTVLWDQDFYNAPYLTAADLGTLLNPQTAIEVAAGITPTGFQYPTLDPRRYASLNDWAAIYNSISALADTFDAWYRLDHAQHPTLTNAICGYKSFNDALLTGTVGWHCTAFGSQALQFNGQSVTAGGTNTAFGYAALEHNVEGSGNTAIGPECFNALAGLNSSHNVGVGYRVGAVLVNGVQNNFFGFQVATNLISGQNNHCYGESSVVNMTLGNGNHCFGYQSGWTAPIADYMHAFGYQALFNQTTSVITGITKAASAVVTFNSAASANPFTAGSAVGFETVGGMSQVNGLMAVVTAVGGSVGAWTVTVALNSSAFSTYTTGGNIFPVGNTAFGYRAAPNVTLGSANVVIGHQAGEGNAIGDGHVLIGFQAGQQKNTGFGDIGIGYQSLLRCITGGNNTVIGQQAGNFIGFGPVTSTDHVVVGANAGQGIVGALRNVCVGSTSGVNLNGNNNTSVGYNAGSQGSTQTYTNCGTFGANAVPSGSNQITLGDTNIATLRCQVTSITSLSDERFKKNIQQLAIPAEAWADLNPVIFEWMHDNMAPQGPQMGFIAQELDRWQTQWHLEWMNLVDKINPDRWEATPFKLFFPLLRHVQEQDSRMSAIEQRLQSLEAM